MSLDKIGGSAKSEEEIEDIVGAMAEAGYGLEYDDAAGLIASTRRGPNPFDAAKSFEESSLSISSPHASDHHTADNGSLHLRNNVVNEDYNRSTEVYSVSESWETMDNYSLDVGTGVHSLDFDATLRTSGSFTTTAYLRIRDVTAGETILDTSTESTSFSTYTRTYDASNLSGSHDFALEMKTSNGQPQYEAVSDAHSVEKSLDYDSGTVFLEWPHPTDIYEWDVATFTRSSDGETVDVFVGVDDGSGWTRANGGAPISRNYSLADDSNVSPSDSVRIEAELSRADVSNNPTLDSAMRSWVL